MRAPKALALIATAATAVSLLAVGPAGPAGATAPTAAPVLSLPANYTSVSGNPELSWDPVPGALKYRVQVDDNPAFSSPNFDQTTVQRIATPPNALPSGVPLYWRVAGSDSSSNLGPFSGVRSFTEEVTGAPLPESPADGATVSYPDDPAQFSWDPVPGAKSYTLQIDDASDFNGAQSFTTANTTYRLAEPQTVGQSFYWHVFATLSDNSDTAPSQPRLYTERWSSKPTLLSPPNALSPARADLVFSWQAVPGAASYELQVSPNGDWANNISIDANGLRGTQYSPPTTLDNGSYFWRVRAKDSATVADLGDWSDEWQFTRGWVSPDPSDTSERPALVGPAWSAAAPSTIKHVPGSLVTPEAPGGLTWTPIQHAAYYEIEISTDLNFSPGTIQDCYTNHTSFTPYTTYPDNVGLPGTCQIGKLSTGVVYYWHVRGIDAPAGVIGVWSNTGNADTFRFIVDPTIPAVTGPADGAALSTPTITWQAVQGAEKYRVSIFKANNVAVTGSPATTYGLSYTPTSALTATDGPFHWYVQSIDGNGDISAIPAQNTWRAFTLVDPASTTPAPILAAPANSASSIWMPTMTWSPVTGAAKYVVHYGSNGYEYATPLGNNVPYPSFTYGGLTILPGTYFWYVEAKDANNASLAFSTQQTFTVQSPIGAQSNESGVLGTGDYLLPPRCQLPTSCTPVTDTPTLNWAGAPGAGWYIVTIANDANFTNVVRTYGTAYTTLTPRESLVDNQAGQAFYWFVRPCVDSGGSRCGPSPQDDVANNNASAFQKRSKAIVLKAPPAIPPVANQITFTWDDFLATNGASVPLATQEARQYFIQVSTAADFSSTLDSATVDQTTYTAYTKTYPEGPIYWRVQAIDGSGNHLTFSDPGTVTKKSPAPALSSPTDKAVVTGVPALAWQPPSTQHAARYAVEVYKNADTNFSTANRVVNATVKFAAYSPTIGLPSGAYVWRVRALDEGGLNGPWTSTREFNLQAAAATLVGPADGVKVSSSDLLFSWSSNHAVAQYRWQLSATSGFTTLQSSQTTVMSSWAPPSAPSDGTHYWRVLELDGSGNVIATSGSRSFTEDATAPKVTADAPTSSASITGPFTATFSEPVQHVSTSTFTLVTAGTTTTVASSVSATSTTATLRPLTQLIPGQSYTLTLTSGITDMSGNPLVPKSWTVRTSTTVEDTSPAFRMFWDSDSSSSASGGTYHASSVGGSSSTFVFSGTNVALVGTRAANGGYASIYVDGIRKTTTASFYSSLTRYQQTIWSTAGLANARHTVQVVVAGTKPAGSSGTWVNIDAYKVGSTLYQENNGAVVERFRQVATTSASGDSYCLAIHATSGDTGSRPVYAVRFRGTSTAVYGVRSTSSGSAAIYLDGAYRGTVSLRGATAYRYLLYRSPTLTDGLHTVQVVVLGTASGSGSTVALDYVSVS